MHVVALAEKRDRNVQASAVVHLLARVFGNVSIEGADPKKNLGLPASLRVLVGEEHRASASAFIVLTPDVFDGGGRPVLYADNRGWTAYLSSEAPCSAAEVPENPLSALYAAGLAVNEVFNIVFQANVVGSRVLSGSILYDVLAGRLVEEPRVEPSLDSLLEAEIDVCLVGAGAVGQAMVYALGMLPRLRGRFHAIDHEIIERDNIERYILASEETLNKVKAHFAAAYLAKRFPLLDVGFNVPAPAGGQWIQQYVGATIAGESAAYPGWTHTALLTGVGFTRTTYQQWRAHEGSEPRGLVVCAVDSAKARRDIQFGMHRVVLNGWTETGLGLQSFGVGRHVIGPSACMACMYQQLEPEAPDPLDFDQRLTGLHRERLRVLREDRSQIPTREELEAIARHRNVAYASIAHAEGKPLAAALQQLCGISVVQDQDRLGTNPVAHVGFLVGVQLAAFVLLESSGWPAGQPTVLQGDARTLPRGAHAVPHRAPREQCLCGDEKVRAHYDRLWNGRPG